ncbi:hypothetical protein D3C86_1698640 [compost metagenome]
MQRVSPGTSAMPTPAATSPAMVEASRASCTMRGLKPALAHRSCTFQYKPMPALRGYITSGSSRRSAMRSGLPLSRWSRGTTAISGDWYHSSTMRPVGISTFGRRSTATSRLCPCTASSWSSEVISFSVSTTRACSLRKRRMAAGMAGDSIDDAV